jgi:hypothetical protein
MITDHQASYFAHELTRRRAPDSTDRLAGAVAVGDCWSPETAATERHESVSSTEKTREWQRLFGD